MTLPLLIATLLSAADASNASEQLRETTETKVRSDVQDLLGRLCADRCFVLGVSARIEEVTESVDEPGFEQLAKKTSTPTVRSIAVSVVAADTLPPDFRARLKPLITQRLKPLAPQVQVSLEVVKLPSDEPELESAPPPVAEVPVAKEPPWEWKPALVHVLVSNAPLLLASLLFAIAIFSAALVLRSRPSREKERPSTPDLPVTPPSPIVEVKRELPKDRIARIRVVREALLAKEWELISAWHAAYGAALFEDSRGQLRSDALGPLQAALERPPARVEEACRVFDARMTAAKLATSIDPAAECFDFLESAKPSAFLAAVRSLSAEERSTALRFAPAHLRKHVFATLSASERSTLALSWSASAAVPVELARTVASQLKSAVDNLGGSDAPEEVLAELLHPLSRAEQDALIASLGASGARAAWSTESAIARAPDDVLMAAVSRLPPSRLATYLSSAETPLKDRVLASCTGSIRNEVTAELRQKTVGRAEFHAARAELLQSLRTELQLRGET